MRAIESVNRDDPSVEARSDAMTLRSPEWRIAQAVFASIAEDRLFFQHEVIAAIDAPADILYREALARMTVDNEVMLPGRFIPALEQLGLMRPFDCYVLRRTLDEIRRMPAAYLGCNVSAQSVRDDYWWTSLFRELAAEPRVAARLVVEITESVPVSPVEGRAFVQRLRGLGVRIAIDDFGAGFSADAARMCEPDILKIDRSFLRRVRQGTLCTAEFNRLVRMAQGTAPLVVVEGVETPGDLRVARDAGVQWVQGYYLNAPQRVGSDPPIREFGFLSAPGTPSE
ncbi:EAL domain protein [Paraburkholderia xenovorans LB400]|uniref:Diguanylate phosphodiesterase n=2 Tax=Paraburkholderia xenovorans TaxID=36873 RepID=Q13FV3_PARXL|nr:diguanylate phosphodiesterase [Paraburkholderia xenovorans LB400]AIP34712.1 EAL domain protein [Paraburkholderia xenovorans LB400]